VHCLSSSVAVTTLFKTQTIYLSTIKFTAFSQFIPQQKHLLFNQNKTLNGATLHTINNYLQKYTVVQFEDMVQLN